MKPFAFILGIPLTLIYTAVAGSNGFWFGIATIIALWIDWS